MVICPAVAARNAPEHRSEHHDGSVEDEIALLVVHGILHVLGHDHAEPEETARMQAGSGAAQPIPPAADRRWRRVSSDDWLLIGIVVVLFLFSILLAVAETALTRPRCRRPRRWRRRRVGRATLLQMVEHQGGSTAAARVLASQTVQSLLLGSIAGNGLGLVVIGVLNITVFFVFAEVAPKTWAILHTERAAPALRPPWPPSPRSRRCGGCPGA